MIIKNIRKIYDFKGYGEFANKIQSTILKSSKIDSIHNDKKIQRKISKIYSNRIIIIDEIHNTRPTGDKEDKKLIPILKAILKYSTNINLFCQQS